MKSNAAFYITDKTIKFLQTSVIQAGLVTAVDVLNIQDRDDAQISQALIEFIKKRKLNFTESRVTVIIPRSRVILRLMQFPSQNEEEIRSMINLQVGTSIPYAREEVEMDFQVLAKTPDGYASAAVVILPQEAAMRYWKIFSDANIPVHGITISSTGLWLLYRRQLDLSEKPGGIIDLDADHSEICLCHQSHWLTSREIPVGLTQIEQGGALEILKQWELTLRNTGSEKLAVPPESVYLVSSTQRPNTLAAEMTNMQNLLTVREIYLTQTLNLARDVQWPGEVTEQGLSLAPLAGIALSAETPPINLVPTAVRQAEEQRVYQRQLAVAGIWIAGALISLGLAMAVGFFKKNIQLAHINEQIRATRQETLETEGQLQKIHDIENMIKNRLVFADMAHEISRLLPPQVYLASITISDGNTMSFQGVSSNSVDVNQFQKGLVESQKFSNVSLDYVNKRVTQQGEVDYFKITCAVKNVNSQHEET